MKRNNGEGEDQRLSAGYRGRGRLPGYLLPVPVNLIRDIISGGTGRRGNRDF